MPLGFQRLNERVRRPNELINFIKPLPSADEATARDFLERVAAIVYPIMKMNHIAVMALEEFPPNREFWGRNFNAGEVIQLVLKNPSGAWLPFRQVQMVMIHELAHCKEMNHSRFFWRSRDAFAVELRSLWQKGYTGEGFWGAGRGVQNGAYLRNEMPAEMNMPQSLCGGVYRNKGKRRRTTTKSELTWAERKQKRILKKFGAGGTTLGGDDEERRKLERGKNVKGKPRVAGSARARELRAAAALARLGSTKSENVKEEPASDDSSMTEDEASQTDEEDAQTIKTENKHLIRVCDGVTPDDADVKREQEELSSLWRIPARPKLQAKDQIETRRTEELGRDEGLAPAEISKESYQDISVMSQSTEKHATISAEDISVVTCGACSCANDADATICIACSNVLDPVATWSHWRCSSTACKDGAYINLGDYGRCQVCGASRQKE